MQKVTIEIVGAKSFSFRASVAVEFKRETAPISFDEPWRYGFPNALPGEVVLRVPTKEEVLVTLCPAPRTTSKTLRTLLELAETSQEFSLIVRSFQRPSTFLNVPHCVLSPPTFEPAAPAKPRIEFVGRATCPDLVAVKVA